MKPDARSGRRRWLLGGGIGLAASTAFLAPRCACAQTPSDDAFALPKGRRYVVKPIAERIYWVSDGAYSTMFLVGDDGVIACDAPPTLGLNYPAAIREVTPLPLTHLVYSHEHVDHIGASTVFPAGIEIIASEATARLLRGRKDPLRRLPTRTFEDTLEVSVRSHRPGGAAPCPPWRRSA